MLIGGGLGYHLLKRISPGGARCGCHPSVYDGRSKLEVLLGPGVWEEVRDRVVLDFGCGTGQEAVDVARHGARRVIGVDIRQHALAEARRLAAAGGLADRCCFGTSTDETADIILSLDSFEHFADPAATLRLMGGRLGAQGYIWTCFGPTWLHPNGGHLFSVFPWAHLLFTEGALMRWRSDFKTDGATRFGEVEGGLNQMTIRRFEKLVGENGFQFKSFEAVPIRVARPFHNRLTREFLTSIVRCRIVRKG